MTDAPLYYALATGTEVVPVNGDKVLLRSDTTSLALEGPSATVFAERILPLLDGRRTLAEVAATLPSLAVSELRAHLDALVDAHVLIRSTTSKEEDESGPASFAALLENLGMPRETALAQLASLHVVVLGLEGAGAHAAEALARAGVGRLTLVDPYPCAAGDQGSAHWDPSMLGRPRQEALRSVLAGATPGVHVDVASGETVEKDAVSEIARGVSLLITTFDRSFAAANNWVNRASLAEGVPALYGHVEGHRWIAGPLVIPGKTPCYLCWRMRSIACQEDFASAMAYEEYLDGRRSPWAGARPCLPSLPAHLGSVLATEALKMLLALGTLTLAGHATEFDALSGTLARHPVLFRPDCPACSKKKGQPELPELVGLKPGAPPADILAAEPFLVSPRCGIVRSCALVTKDPSEPEVPYVARAELGNHRFLSETGDEFMVGSGKGFTPEQAKAGALGEAVERYSASLWTGACVRLASRAELAGASLDPRRLVLFRPEQYADLKYTPYQDQARMGWVESRSLASDETVYVPAVAVFMAYEVPRPEEFIAPITSNGLAAGPTLASAVRSAALEVVERDAFLNSWLHRLPATRVDASTHPDPRVVSVVRAYGRRGVHMELFRLGIDHPIPVFAALGVQDGDGPAVVLGLAADLSSTTAARRAILEVAQIRPALRIRLRRDEVKNRVAELVEDPRRVTTLDDHDLLYTSPRMTSAFDFLRDTNPAPYDWHDGDRLDHRDDGVEPDPVEELEAIAHHLADLGTELLYCDLTTADVLTFGIHTVRVLIPDFQPIHFGRGERRLGGTRLYDVPRRLGLRETPAGVDDLNDLPHPLA